MKSTRTFRVIAGAAIAAALSMGFTGCPAKDSGLSKEAKKAARELDEAGKALKDLGKEAVDSGKKAAGKAAKQLKK